MQHKCNIKCPRQPRLATWTRNRPSLTPSQTPIYICTFALWMLKTAVRIRHLQYIHRAATTETTKPTLCYIIICINTILHLYFFPFMSIVRPTITNMHAQYQHCWTRYLWPKPGAVVVHTYIYSVDMAYGQSLPFETWFTHQPKQTTNGSWPDRGVEATVSAVSALDHFATTTTNKKGRNLLRDYEWMIFA